LFYNDSNANQYLLYPVQRKKHNSFALLIYQLYRLEIKFSYHVATGGKKCHTEVKKTMDDAHAAKVGNTQEFTSFGRYPVTFS